MAKIDAMAKIDRMNKIDRMIEFNSFDRMHFFDRMNFFNRTDFFNGTDFFNKNETAFFDRMDYLDMMNNFDKFFNFWVCGAGCDFFLTNWVNFFSNSNDGNIVHRHNDNIFNEMIIWNIIRRMLKDCFYKESPSLKRIPLRYAKHSNPLHRR